MTIYSIVSIADDMCTGTHIDKHTSRRNQSTTKQINTTKFYKQRHLSRHSYQRTTRNIAIILGSNKVLVNLNTKIKRMKQLLDIK